MFTRNWFHLDLPQTLEFYQCCELLCDTPAELKEMRRYLAKNDLFYLLVDVLSRTDLLHPWLFERCREVQLAPNGYLDLWAREHYKSTIITFGMTILDILNDPEITIGIFSHTKSQAQDFLDQIKQEFESNVDLKYLFDDILWEYPKTQAPSWSLSGGITVKRQGKPKECTIEAWGIIDGMPTGKHFKQRIYDDVVTEESVGSVNMIKKTTKRLELSDNLGAVGGHERYIGTRYHLRDSYADLIERDVVKVRLHPCTSDGTEDWDKAVLMPPEVLKKKRQKQGIFTFNCQMLQNPNADKVQGFQERWLKYWPATHTKNLLKILLVDPASKKKPTSDYTTMWVIGLGGDGNYYIIDIIRDRLNLTGRQKALFELHRTHKPKFVGYEEYGLQADIEHMQYVQEQENYRFDITPLGGKMKKENRILRLVPLYEQGLIYMPTSLIRIDYEGKAVDLVRVFKDEEYLLFPILSHDDMLDGLARVLDPEVMALARPKPQPVDGHLDAIIRKQRRAERPVV